jgi:hypothetical protein
LYIKRTHHNPPRRPSVDWSRYNWDWKHGEARYNEGLVTYPRTDFQKLFLDLKYKKVLSV